MENRESKVWIKSPLTFIEKLELLYLSPYYLQAFLFILGTFSWFMAEVIFKVQLPFWTEVWGWSLVFTNLFALPLMNLVGLFLEEADEKDYIGLFSFIALSYIVAPFQGYAALKGLIEKEEGPWFRTPKTGRITDVFTPGRFYRQIFGGIFGFGKGSPAKETASVYSATPNPYLALATANNHFNNFRIPSHKRGYIGNAVLVFLLVTSLIVGMIAPFIPESKKVFASEDKIVSVADVKSGKVAALEEKKIDTPVIIQRNFQNKSLEFIFHKEPRVRIKYDGKEMDVKTETFAGKTTRPTKATIKGSSVVYLDIIDGVDLVYEAGSKSLVEKFIVKKNLGKSIYKSLINQNVIFNGVKVVWSDPKTFGFYTKENKTIFSFADPSMWEERKASDKNYGLEFSLEKAKIGYTLKKNFTASGKEWFNDQNRSYPIVIDPSIVVSPSTITFDAVTSNASANTPTTVSHTVANQPNRVLIVGISCGNAACNTTSVTYAGVNMTQAIIKYDPGITMSAEIWYLVAPATGANNVVMTQSSARQKRYGIASYYNVDQASPIGTALGANGTSTTPSVSPTTVSGDLVVDTVVVNSNTLTVDASQTQRWNGVDSGGSRKGGGSEELATGTSTTMSWTTGNVAWAIASLPLKQANEIAETEAQFGGLQRKLGYTNSNWYAFYTDASDVWYKKSSDGTTWESAVDVDTTDADNFNSSVYLSGNFIYAAWIDDGSDVVEVNSINTGSSDALGTKCSSASPGTLSTTYMVSVAVDSGGIVYLALTDTAAGTVAAVYKLTFSGCTFTNITTGSGLTAGDRPVLVTVGTTLHMIFQDGNLSHSTYNGTSWATSNTTIASVTDSVYSVATDGTSVWALSVSGTTATNLYKYNGSSWSTLTTPWTGQTNLTSASITYDSTNSRLVAHAIHDTSEQAYFTGTDATTISWDAETSYGFTAGDLGHISAPMTGTGSTDIGVVLRQGTNLEFATVPENIIFLLLLLPILPGILAKIRKKGVKWRKS